jgi:hypothetical protein
LAGESEAAAGAEAGEYDAGGVEVVGWAVLHDLEDGGGAVFDGGREGVQGG